MFAQFNRFEIELTKIQAVKESEIEALKAQIAQKETETQGFAFEKSNLKKQLADAEEKLTSAGGKLVISEETLDELRKGNAILSEKLEKILAQWSTTAESLSDSQTKINFLSVQISQLEQEKIVLEKEIKRQATTIDDLIGQSVRLQNASKGGALPARRPLITMNGSEQKASKVVKKHTDEDDERTSLVNVPLDDADIDAQTSPESTEQVIKDARKVAESPNDRGAIRNLVRSVWGLFTRKSSKAPKSSKTSYAEQVDA